MSTAGRGSERRTTGASAATPSSDGSAGENTALSPLELLLILAFWTFMAVLTAANRLADPRGPVLVGGTETSSVVLAFAQSYLWALLTPLIFIVASRYGVDRSHVVSRVILYVLLGVICALLVDQIMLALQREGFIGGAAGRGRGIGRRGGPGAFGGPLIDGGRVADGGPLLPRGRGGLGGPGRLRDPGLLAAFRRPMILNHFVVYFGVLAAGFARDYFLRYRARQAEALRLHAEAARLHAQLAAARLGALRAQLNPHFLFNTLHAISSLVERDPRGVRRMIARLSELLRYTLEDSGEHEIPLNQEMSFLDRYLDIMRIRFQGALEVIVDVDPAVADALVPNLILQPLVENAVKHGVSKVEGAGRIEIRARREGERTIITVRDNGPGLGSGDEGNDEGVGLRNSRERLEQLYGKAQSLTLADAPHGGTVAELVVPFQTRRDLRAAAMPPASPGAVP